MLSAVPLLDVRAQNLALENELIDAFTRVLRSGQYVLGSEVTQFEERAAKYLGAEFAVGVSSGSDALLLSLMALGVGPGDEVITSPFTFFSTAGSIARLGAKPVFVDIEFDTFNINPAGIQRAVTPRTKAIVPVHLFGQASQMNAIMDIANTHRLFVVEDCAQAIGCRFEGRAVGTFGTTGCFSFFPSKNLGALGDGGLIVTNDETLATKIRLLRQHGSKPKYYHAMVGGNFRIDALQAALLSVKLPHLDTWASARKRNAEAYQGLLRNVDAANVDTYRSLTLPKCVREGHVWNQFTLRCKRRDALKSYLADQRIGHEIYYPLPLHLQDCFKSLGYHEGDLPQAEQASKEVISIPIFPELQPAQLEHIVNLLIRFTQGL